MAGFIMEGPRPLDWIASTASGSRTFDAVTITGDELLPPGTLLAGEVGGNFTKAAEAGEVTAILLYWADLRETNEASVAAATRDAEVTDAYLVTGDMDPAEVATALRAQNIIVRRGVLTNPATEFAMSRQPWPAE